MKIFHRKKRAAVRWHEVAANSATGRSSFPVFALISRATRWRKGVFCLWTIFASATAIRGQSPVITRIVPAAVSSGETTISIYGENLRGAAELWTSFPAEKIALENDATGGPISNKTRCKVRLPMGATPLLGALRLATTNGLSELRLLAIDNYPNAPAPSERTDLAHAASVKPPCAVDGFLRPTSSEFYQIAARRGEFISVEVIARRLGSRLDPVLRFLDMHGRELAFCDDEPGLGSDAMINYRAPATGHYIIEIRDLTYRGGEDFFYRLRVGKSAHAFSAQLERLEELRPQSGTVVEKEPNDSPPSAMRLEIPTTVAGRFQHTRDRDYYEFTATAGERLVFRGQTRSLGSPCDLFLRLSRADGTFVADADVNGADDSTLTNKFAESGRYYLLVEELNRNGGDGFFYRLAIEKLQPGFALTVETNRIEAATGVAFEMKINCVRQDYDGPVTLALQGAGEALKLVEGQIAEKQTNAVLKAMAEQTWPPGKIVNFTIAGRAEVAGRLLIEQASTAMLLKRQFPRITWPRELDGLIALGIKAPPPRLATDSAATGGGK